MRHLLVLLRHIRTFVRYVHFVKLVPEQTSYHSLAVTLGFVQVLQGLHVLAVLDEMPDLELKL